MALLVTVAAFLISICLSRSFTKRIGQLEQSMRQVVSALAAFYKVSLSNGEDQIPIQEELRRAWMYLAILDYRFADRIRTEWDIAPEIEDCPIVKIVLQPQIENASCSVQFLTIWAAVCIIRMNFCVFVRENEDLAGQAVRLPAPNGIPARQKNRNNTLNEVIAMDSSLSYTGSRPYIFISYSHANLDQILPRLRPAGTDPLHPGAELLL